MDKKPEPNIPDMSQVNFDNRVRILMGQLQRERKL